MKDDGGTVLDTNKELEDWTDELAVAAWWEKLSDQERCWWAAKLAGADTDVLYAIEKPWKWKNEAYEQVRSGA